MVNTYPKLGWTAISLSASSVVIGAISCDPTFILFFAGIWFAGCAMGCMVLEISINAILPHQRNVPIKLYSSKYLREHGLQLLLLLIASILFFSLGAFSLDAPFRLRISLMTPSLIFLICIFMLLTKEIIPKVLSERDGLNGAVVQPVSTDLKSPDSDANFGEKADDDPLDKSEQSE